MTRYWRITFKKDGSINQVREVKSPGHSRWIVVEAADEATAKQRAYNMYCARKKKEVRIRNHAQKKCTCGRPQDRTNGDGTLKKTCSVCAVRQAAWHADNYKRHQEGNFEPKVRDEAARIEKCKERVRDRKSEIRIEVLTEVRAAWQNSNTIGHFTAWLKQEIEKCMSSCPSSTDGEKQSLMQ